MRHTVYFILPFLYLSFVMLACSKSVEQEWAEVDVFEDPEPVTNLIIENNKVVCESCEGFGHIIESDQNQIFVGGERQVWIFNTTAQGISLSQEIDVTSFGFINSITAKDGSLFLGVYDEFGTGSVRQYAASGQEWQFKTSYQIGRNQDDFGNDIAISDTLMVIGASARWSESANVANMDEGRFYIFNNKSSDWIQTQEFDSENPTSDDRFGTDVIIADSFILVGGLSIPMHVYSFDGDVWQLESVENDIIPADIANFGNIILYYSEMLGLRSFMVNADGSFTSLPINANLDLSNGVRFSSDSISMTADHALITTLGGQQVYLLNYENDQWTLENVFSSEEGMGFEYTAIKIDENRVITAGTISSVNKSYLYINTYL